ncbi:hypothetical protein BN903_42 [Halorubrum sp. AJ67]|nr:hypothetical protein BN903_42 [Halorubrum sp. AJ67]
MGDIYTCRTHETLATLEVVVLSLTSAKVEPTDLLVNPD